jgi:hypothetical protein
MDLENKVKGIGQELALFQQRYFAERENLNKRLDELNARCGAIEAITSVLPVKVNELSKLLTSTTKAVEELEKEFNQPVEAPMPENKKWWERILK